MTILEMGHIIIRTSRALLVVGCTVVCTVVGARAEILPVASEILATDQPREIVHTLEAMKSGVRLGVQHSRFVVDGDRLRIDVMTRFEDGLVWVEHGVMNVRDGYRALAYRKVTRRGGAITGELHVDFSSGEVWWTSDGARHQQTFSFAPDTYTGAMLAFVLASVPQKPQGSASFELLTFRPDPRVYRVRADVIDRGTCEMVTRPEPATKLRLKADLGPVGNTLFAQLIPTHYFWYTQERPPDFFAFEGQLGHNGPEIVMFPRGFRRAIVSSRGRTVFAEAR